MICPVCQGEMWDNRPKKISGEFKSNSPDFKCKDKNCSGVIWPEPKKDKPAVFNESRIQKPEYTPPKTAEPRDSDAENRGKVRHGIIVAMIERDGLQSTVGALMDDEDLGNINRVVEFIMTGK